MLATVFSNLIAVNRRRAIQLFPESLARHWNTWELRALVLFSFSLQAILIFLGNRRKYKFRIWVRIIIWMAFQASDWATNFSLSVLSHGQDDCKTNSLDPDYVIMAFWAPLFLLHLCSPDTITAYSSEDNELYLRHIFSIGGLFGVAIYVLHRSWTSTPINYLAILMLFAAFVKFAERTWVQYMASSSQFRDSILPRPDPGPNYAKFMDAYTAKQAEGFQIERGPLIIESLQEDYPPQNATDCIALSDDEILCQAYSFFEAFKRLFADLILSFQDYKRSRSFFLNHSDDDAYKVVEVELGLIYDILYTKAIVIYSDWALYIRLFSLTLSVSVFSVFLVFYSNDFSKTSVKITCILLVGANFLEIMR